MDKSSVIPVIGLSPRNSYYNEPDNIGFAIDETVAAYGRAFIMVADLPDAANLTAFGEDDAALKAKKSGDVLKQRVRDYCAGRYTPEQVHIIGWAEEIESSDVYRKSRAELQALYDRKTGFYNEVREATRAVIDHRYKGSRGFREFIDYEKTGKGQPRTARTEEQKETAKEKSVDLAVHYILSEFAFLETAPGLFGGAFAQYVYHRDWPVYEKYINGAFDRKSRTHLGFHVTERLPAPVAAQAPDNVLRAAYSFYPPGMYRGSDNEYRGIFFDLLKLIAARNKLTLEISPYETGYDGAVGGLNNDLYDVFCSPTWPTEDRRLEAVLSDPLFTSEVGVWVRADHPLARLGPDGLDDERNIFAIKDNDVTQDYAGAYERARRINTPAGTSIPDLLDRVVQGRATATFVEPVLAGWCRENGLLKGELVNIAGDPIDMPTNHFLLPAGRKQWLVPMFNTTLKDLRREGVIAECVKAHTGRDDTFGFNLPMLSGGRGAPRPFDLAC